MRAKTIVHGEVDCRDGLKPLSAPGRIHIEGRAVHEWNMQGFDQSFGDGLPVGGERLMRERAVILHPLTAKRRDLRVDLTEMARDVDRTSWCEDHPYEAMALLARQLDQAELAIVERRISVRQRRAYQLTLGVVGPGMIRAREPSRLTAALRRLRAAVAAIIEERVRHTILVASQQDRSAHCRAHEITIRLRNFARREKGDWLRHEEVPLPRGELLVGVVTQGNTQVALCQIGHFRCYDFDRSFEDLGLVDTHDACSAERRRDRLCERSMMTRQSSEE